MLSRRLTRGLAWVLLGIGLARPSAAVDTILVHGHVFTGKGDWAEAIAVNGGRIEALRTSTAHLIDLQGRSVLPGIIDSLLHMLFGALELHGLNLSTPDGSLTPDNAEQSIAKLSEFAASHPDDEVVGQSLDGAGQGGAVAVQTVYNPSERLSVQEAVEAYTAGSAYATFQEKQLGTLEPGKLADLIVLSQDIFSIAPETISTTRVLLTMVEGKVVYERP